MKLGNFFGVFQVAKNAREWEYHTEARALPMLVISDSPSSDVQHKKVKHKSTDLESYLFRINEYMLLRNGARSQPSEIR